MLWGGAQNAKASTRDRIRAAQTLIAAERINQQEDAAQDSPAVAPEITVINDDPEYWKWRHMQSRKQWAQRGAERAKPRPGGSAAQEFATT